MFDYDQKNSAHQYELWKHFLHVVLGIPKNVADNMLYLAALLHDIGKPDCAVKGSRPGDNEMHYYNHPQKSLEIVKNEIISLLEKRGQIISEEEKERLFYYVAYHDDRISLKQKHLKRHLTIANFEEFQKLMLLQKADAPAHVQIPIIEERVSITSQWLGNYGHLKYEEIMKKPTRRGEKHVYIF